MTRLHRVCVLFLLFLAITATLSAQSERGAIRGTVTDSSGAAMVGVRVVAINEATGVRTETITTDAGNYSIPQLPAGMYRVEAEQAGFKKFIRENIRLAVSQTIGVDIGLEPGEVTTTITVSEAIAQLKSESSDVSTEVNPKSFMDLPLQVSGGSGRSVENFIFLAPGTSGNTFDAHINGSQTLSKEIQIDGLSLTTAEVGGDPRVLPLPPEAVQEFSLVTSSYSAEFGNTGGGVERLVVRSGTNDLHGNAYEFLRNDKLDARGFFNAERSVQRRNEFGFSVGGPIYVPGLYNGRNRSFFFTNWHWYKFRSGTINQTATVPTQAFRNGDFSALTNASGLIQLYDPNTTRQEGGVFVRDPFPGNQIPGARHSTVSRNILGFVPNPAIDRIFDNFPAAGISRNDNRNFTHKINHNITDNHRLAGTWNWGINRDNGPFAPLPRPIANSRDGVKGPEHNAVRIAEDWIISPTVLNHFNIGLTRQFQLLQAPEQGQGFAEAVGLRGVFNGPFPRVEFAGAPYTGYGVNQDLLQTVSTTYLLSNGLSMVRGKHNWKFGIEYRRLHNNFSQGARSGDWSFARNQTALPTAISTTGDAFASFLLGEVSSGNLLINQVTKGMRISYFGAYVQDDYKITPRLTLNLGLRWDLFTPMVEVNNAYSIMDPDVPNPNAGGFPGALVFAGDCSGCTGTRRLTDARQISYDNWGPRLGLAWTLNDKLVLRTAYGISYFPSGPLGGGNSKPPSDGFTTTFVRNSLDGVTPGMHWDNGFPINEFTFPPFINPGFGTGGPIAFWNTGGTEPQYTQSFNFTFQYKLAPTWLLDMGWVGQKSTRISTGVFNPQQVHPQYLSLGETLRLNINDPAVRAAGFAPPYAGFNGPLNQALRRFPQYQGLGLTRSDNVGNSTYHSLQIKLEREFTSGLWVLSSYTWAKTLTDASSSLSGFFSTTARDHYNRSLEKGLALYDLPHRAVAAINYELPIGPGKAVNVTGPLGKVVGGWQVNAILNYQVGLPIGIGIDNALPLFNSRNLPNAVAGANPILADKSNFDPARDLLLNAQAFTQPAALSFGNAASILTNARAFNLFNEDFGIMKRTYLRGESMNIEFRFELFNAFNRVQFGGPATNFSNLGNFGRVTSQGNAPRSGQFALKFNF